MTQVLVTGDKASRFAARIARRAENKMPDLCVVVSTQSEVDTRGRSPITPVELPLQEDVDPRDFIPCRVDSRAGQERTINGIVMSVTVYYIKMPAMMPDGKTAIVIAEKDWLRVLPRGPIPERLVHVESVAMREGVMIDVVGLKPGG